MCALLITELLQLVARLGSVNRFHRTSWLPVASPTDRSKSARNRGVIEVFGGVFVLSLSCFSLNIFYSELKGMLHKYAKFIPNKGFEKKNPKMCIYFNSSTWGYWNSLHGPSAVPSRARRSKPPKSRARAPEPYSRDRRGL